MRRGRPRLATPGRLRTPGRRTARGPDVTPPLRLSPPLGAAEHPASIPPLRLPPLHPSRGPPKPNSPASPRTGSPSPAEPPGLGVTPPPVQAASGNHRHPRKRHRHPRPSLRFQGPRRGSGDSKRPRRRSCPPLSPALGGREAVGPKAESAGGGSPPAPPSPCPCGGPDPPPRLTRLTLQETGHRRICFPARPAPRAPCSPRRRAATLRRRGGQAARPGLGARGRTKGPLWRELPGACGLARTRREGQRTRGPGALAPGREAGRGQPPACGFGQGPQARRGSPGPASSGDERGTRLGAWSKVAREGRCCHCAGPASPPPVAW